MFLIHTNSHYSIHHKYALRLYIHREKIKYEYYLTDVPTGKFILNVHIIYTFIFLA